MKGPVEASTIWVSTAMNSEDDTHSIVVGYLYWLFGFTGSHRFYYGKPVTGAMWVFTAGLLLIGWIVDLFLIPGMDQEASDRYRVGGVNHSAAWILFTFLGVLGVHRFYMGKWVTGLLYLLTGALFGLGLLYDLVTLNEQVDDVNITEFRLANMSETTAS